MDMIAVDDFISAVNFDINKILLAGEPDELDKYQEILSKRYDGLLDVYKSAPYFLEIMPFGVSKGSMLPLLLEKLGVKPEETVYLGDTSVDMETAHNTGALAVARGAGSAAVRLRLTEALETLLGLSPGSVLVLEMEDSP